MTLMFLGFFTQNLGPPSLNVHNTLPFLKGATSCLKNQRKILQKIHILNFKKCKEAKN